MQLTNKKPNVAKLLTLATCSLLGTAPDAIAAEDTNQWRFDTALMYYGESERVTAVEGIIAASKEFSDQEFLNLKLTLDTLTGASANGAVAQPNVQTFTRPSGRGSYDIEAKDTPLDDTFRDSRVQVNAQWSQPLAENYLGSVGAYVSSEHDYFSLGFNANIAREFYNKNTTLSFGIAAAQDQISPEGGLPTPFSEMLAVQDGNANGLNRLGADDDKTTVDLLFGLTQVINRKMIMQFNYSYSQVDGYQTDPYKIVSVVDNNGYALRQLYESRPDSRNKNSVFWQTKYHLTNSVIDFSYRYLWDNWDVKSHTFDVRYHIPLEGAYIEPHVRYYQQQAAEFYQPFLLDGEPTPENISADYRVGEMNGLTLGVKYAMELEGDSELAFRLEFFQQTPTNPGFETPGVLADVELFESVSAVVAQISYSF